MNNQRRSFLFRAVALAGIAFTMSACSAKEEFQRGYLIDERAVAQVKKGIGPEKVLEILGSPSTVSTVGNKSWYYISQKTERKLQFMGESIVDQKVVAVYFNAQFRVERVAQYGIQDGKIFDFISRKTFAGGTDQNFLTQIFQGLLTFEKH